MGSSKVAGGCGWRSNICCNAEQCSNALQVYLYISGDRPESEQILGVAVAQQIRHAYPAVIPQGAQPQAATPDTATPQHAGGDYFSLVQQQEAAQADAGHHEEGANIGAPSPRVDTCDGTPTNSAAISTAPLAAAAASGATPKQRRKSLGHPNTIMRYLTSSGGGRSSGAPASSAPGGAPAGPPLRPPSQDAAVTADCSTPLSCMQSLPLPPTASAARTPLASLPWASPAAAQPAMPVSHGSADAAAQPSAAHSSDELHSRAVNAARSVQMPRQQSPAASGLPPPAESASAARRQQQPGAATPRRRSLTVMRGPKQRKLARVGVRVIWVSSQARRRGIASRILTATRCCASRHVSCHATARLSAVPNLGWHTASSGTECQARLHCYIGCRTDLYPAYVAGREEVALWEPTDDGTWFAQAYTGSQEVLVYND